MMEVEPRAVVVGGGPTGLAAALLLAELAIPVALVFPQSATAARDDRRTAALFSGSVELLRGLGIWSALAPASAPLRGIRIVDDTKSLLRAPETVFQACDAGLPEFGYNVPNAALTVALLARAADHGGLSLIDDTVQSIATTATGAVVHLAGGRQLHVEVVVGADGRQSAVRAAGGIAARTWDYPQAALVAWFDHSRPHHGVSTEFHRPGGPLTTVPMPERSSSLVWVEGRAEAGRLHGLPELDFRDALEAGLNGLLGDVTALGPRGVFPLSGLSAERLVGQRVALVGEAGHVMPPIGAQGLNLGLRDVAALGDALAVAGSDLGAAPVLAGYERSRISDVRTRMAAIDVLNRSLLTGFVPAHLLRGFGLFALSAFAPLRRLVVREGLQPSWSVPVAMTPGGLDRLRGSSTAVGPAAGTGA